jgi:hypothetical protein
METEQKDYILYKISGGYTLISKEDLDIVAKYNWFIDRDGYATAFTINGKVTSVRLHKLISTPSAGRPIVDHKNRVRLDNRRSNLRAVNRTQSYKNRGKQERNAETPYLQEELLARGTPYEPKASVVSKEFRAFKQSLN